MAESVIVTGRDLAVEHQQDKPDPKRRRPKPYTPPSAPTGRTAEQIATEPNPHWSTEANQAAEENRDGLRPIDHAKRWRKHRIDEP